MLRGVPSHSPCEVEAEVEEVLVVEVVQWEQEGSSVWLLLSMCPLVGLVDMAALAGMHICMQSIEIDLHRLSQYLH